MKTIRILHTCAPHYDNLGDIAANEAIAPMFRRRGAEIERIEDDLWARRRERRFLDDRIDEINAEFDMLMIGPSGFLGPKMIDNVFSSVHCWERLSTPLCFNGVGLVASITRPVWYSAMDENAHAVRALAHARAVSTRELNSWLLAARAMRGATERLTLAGCPSIRITRCEPAPPKTHDLALNLSFMHEICRRHVPLLLQIAAAVRAHKRRVLWICHSRIDEIQAAGVNRRLGLGFDIVRPQNAAQAGAAYAACHCALVTRFHAGVFCTANAVPFGFLGYDMKCWHLMSMLADEPYQYVLPIDRLANDAVDSEVHRLFRRLEDTSESMRRAEQTLVKYFDEQTDRFVDMAIAAVHGTMPHAAGSAVAGMDVPHEMTGGYRS